MNFNGLVTSAISKAGKQESLATILDLAPSALSKRINGEVGWTDREMNGLLEFVGLDICNPEKYNKQVETLKDAMKILLNGKDIDEASE